MTYPFQVYVGPPPAESAVTGLVADLAAIQVSPVLLRPTVKLPTSPRRQIITIFAAGHGFTTTAGGSSADDATNYVLGSQSLSITTSGGGAGTPCLTSHAGLTAVNADDHALALLVRVPDLTHLSALQVVAGDTAFGNAWTFAAGGGAAGGAGVLGSDLRTDEWTWIYFTQNNGANKAGTYSPLALTDWQINVVDDGTPTTVKVGALAIVPNPRPFPNGVVTFSFDDNYVSQYALARPYLDNYGYGATAWIIADQVPVGGSTSMTLAQLNELQNSHNWEIAGHAYSVVNHNAGFSSLSSAALLTEVQNLKQWLINNSFRGADMFAYPLSDDAAVGIPATVGEFFSVARHGGGGARQTLNLNQPMRVKTYLVTSSTTLGQIQTEVDNAYKYRNWLILEMHVIVASGATGAVQMNLATFQSAVDYVATKGIPARTFGEVVAALNGTGQADKLSFARSVDVQTFTQNGTWTKPAGAQTVEVIMVSGGGGGGSGRRGAAGTVRCGGGGGGGGTMTRVSVPAATWAGTETVTFGGTNPAPGGGAVAVDNTDGNPGTSGCSVTFSTGSKQLRSGQGVNGLGGTNATGTGGASSSSAMFQGTSGASASTTGLVGNAGNNALAPTSGAAGGASGGGITSGDVASAGGGGATTGAFPVAANATAGAIGTAGGNANDHPVGSGFPGGSGAGGGSSITGVAGAGGNGGLYGGGGGGGGASLNGNNSGAGGAGALAVCIVVTRF